MIGPCAFILFILSRVISTECLSIITPSNWSTGQNVTLYWTAGQNDADQFRLELFNTRLLQEPLTISVTLETDLDSFTFLMPPVLPGDGYILSFVDVSDDNTVYTSSAPFIITYGAPSSDSIIGSPQTPGAPPPPGGTPPLDPFGNTITIYSTVIGPPTTITLTSTRTPTPSHTLHSGNKPRALNHTKSWWIEMFLVYLLCNLLSVPI